MDLSVASEKIPSDKTGDRNLDLPTIAVFKCARKFICYFFINFYLKTKHNRNDVVVNSLNFLMSLKLSVLRSGMGAALQLRNAQLCRILFCFPHYPPGGRIYACII
jgi:hypothetical protein